MTDTAILNRESETVAAFIAERLVEIAEVGKSPQVRAAQWRRRGQLLGGGGGSNLQGAALRDRRGS